MAPAMDFPQISQIVKRSCPGCGFLGYSANHDEHEFDPTRSTEDNYSVEHFTGTNASIRPLLDYTWHKKYITSRVELQDKLIDSAIQKCQTRGSNMLPWVVFTAGAMGAGKGYVIRWMDQKGYLPLNNFVVVDPDAIRQLLPEWKTYIARDPSTAGDMTQKEAGCIAEIMGFRALRERGNVIFDGSLRDSEWYLKYFAKLREDYPGVRIMIIHICADREETLKRAEERAERTGRKVPVELLEQSMAQVPKSVAALAPKADFVCRVMNYGGKDPKLEPVEEATSLKGIEVKWETIANLWQELDINGDGKLSKQEVERAVALGLVTEATLQTVDVDRDGSITKKEIRAAEEKAMKSATKKYK